MDMFCAAGPVQQAEQLNHLAEGRGLIAYVVLILLLSFQLRKSPLARRNSLLENPFMSEQNGYRKHNCHAAHTCGTSQEADKRYAQCSSHVVPSLFYNERTWAALFELRQARVNRKIKGCRAVTDCEGSPAKAKMCRRFIHWQATLHGLHAIRPSHPTRSPCQPTRRADMMVSGLENHEAACPPSYRRDERNREEGARMQLALLLVAGVDHCCLQINFLPVEALLGEPNWFQFKLGIPSGWLDHGVLRLGMAIFAWSKEFAMQQVAHL
eukprot:236452-Pelagomonas_calceolata.AAC.2